MERAYSLKSEERSKLESCLPLPTYVTLKLLSNLWDPGSFFII